MSSPPSRRASARWFLVASLTILGSVPEAQAQAAANADRNLSSAIVRTAAPLLRGAYFGQALPGETPVPFAAEILGSVSPWVEATAFSPDGSQFFLAVGSADYSSAKLYYSKVVNDIWSPFVAAPFAADFTYANEPVFSSDGSTVTFAGKKAAGSVDLWTVRPTERGWDPPAPLPSPINSDGKDHRGSTAANGTRYFGSTRSGMMQIYSAHEDAGGKLGAELLGAPVNMQSYEGDPCVAPDGRFLIFYSARDGRSADLYVSFADGRGGWGAPIHLGAAFNSPDDEYGAHLSPDGKLLFFTRHTAQGNSIYWVAASAIEKVKA